MKMVPWFAALLASLLFAALASPALASAFSIRYDSSVKAALDKLDPSTKLASHYNESVVLQKRIDGLDERIAQTHAEGEQALLVVRKQMKLIDADKIGKLEAQLKQAKDRYQPLFDDYKAVNGQINAAKYLPSKELKAALRLKADAMKPAVTLARQDIRVKQAALSTAKQSAAKSAKKIRDVLEGIDAVKVKIRAEKAAAAIPAKHFSAAWSSFNKAVRKSNAKSAEEALEDLNSLLRQAADRKQAVHALEAQIVGIVLKAKALLPSGN